MTKEQEFVLELRKLEARFGLYLETSEWLNLQDKPASYPAENGSLSVLNAQEQAEVLTHELAQANRNIRDCQHSAEARCTHCIPCEE